MSKAAIAVIAAGVFGAGVYGLWHFHPESVRTLVAQTPLNGLLSASTPVYQWRDARGNWQVTDEPPEGVPYELKQYDLDANIQPPFRVTDE